MKVKFKKMRMCVTELGNYSELITALVITLSLYHHKLIYHEHCSASHQQHLSTSFPTLCVMGFCYNPPETMMKYEAGRIVTQMVS